MKSLLPGEAKKKPPPTKLNIKPGEVLCSITSRELRQILRSKSTYPVNLNFNSTNFQLNDLHFLKECPNIIKDLNVSSNALVALVGSHEHLSKMKRLVADKNYIKDASFKNLQTLQLLSLAQNRMEHLPDMTDLKKLVHLNLSGNRISSGFSELAKLKSLQYLNLSRNSIDIPLEDFYAFILIHLKALSKLKILSFQENPVQVKIVEYRLFVLSELPRLTQLDDQLVTKEELKKAEKEGQDGTWGDKTKREITLPRPQSQVLVENQEEKKKLSGQSLTLKKQKGQPQHFSMARAPSLNIRDKNFLSAQRRSVLPDRPGDDVNYLAILNDLVHTDADNLTTTGETDTIEASSNPLADSKQLALDSDSSFLDFLSEMIEEIGDTEETAPLSTPTSSDLEVSEPKAIDVFDLINEVMEQKEEGSGDLDFDDLLASSLAETDPTETKEEIKKWKEEEKKDEQLLADQRRSASERDLQEAQRQAQLQYQQEQLQLQQQKEALLKQEEEWRRQRQEEEERLRLWKEEQEALRLREQEETQKLLHLKHLAEEERRKAELLRKEIEEERQKLAREQEELEQRRAQQLALLDQQSRLSSLRHAEELERKRKQFEEELQLSAQKRLQEEQDSLRRQRLQELELEQKKKDYEVLLQSAQSSDVSPRLEDFVSEIVLSSELGQGREVSLNEVKIQEKLGLGTYGLSWRGVWTSTGRDLVAKQLALKDLSPSLLQLLRREALYLGSLEHPSLVRLLGLSLDHSPYALWELVAGVSLHTVLSKAQKVTFPFVVKTCRGICTAMEFLHRNEIVHRCLKAKNILFDKGANVKVSDYGFSAVKEQLGKTFVFTCPAYAAPEYLLDNKLASPALDVYSFGILLWELCSNNVFPYGNWDSKQIIVSVLKNGARPHPPEESPQLFQTLMRACWSSDLQQRPSFTKILVLLNKPLDLLLTYSPPEAGPKDTQETPSTKEVTSKETPPSEETQREEERKLANLNVKVPPMVEKVVKYLEASDAVTLAKALKAVVSLAAASEENVEGLVVSQGVRRVAQLLSFPDPSVQEAALDASLRLVDDFECASQLCEEGGVKKLVEKLQSGLALQAAQVLSKLAVDEVYRGDIVLAGALPPLVFLLSSPEAALVVEVAQVLSQLLEDEQVHLEFHQLGGVEKLLLLQNSPHTALRLHVLVGLSNLLTNDQFMVPIAQAGVPAQFVRLLASKSSTLQKYAVQAVCRFSSKQQLRLAVGQMNVLSPLLDLCFSSEDFIASSALKALTNFCNDENFKPSFKSLEKVGALIPLLTGRGTEVVLSLVRFFTALSFDETNQRVLVSSIPIVLKLLKSPSDELKRAVTELLSCLSTSGLEQISQGGGVEQVLPFLDSQDDELRLHTIRLLGQLISNKQNREQLRHQGGLEKIVNLLACQHQAIREATAMALTNLSDDATFREVIRQARGLFALVEMMKTSYDRVRERVFWCVSNFALDEKSHPIILEAHGLEIMIENLFLPSTQSVALKCLLILSQSKSNREHIIKAGGLEALKKLAQTAAHPTIKNASQKALTILSS